MIKISYVCDTCGTVHSRTFDTWDAAYNYCSQQDRRQTSTGHTDTFRDPNYDGPYRTHTLGTDTTETARN